MKIDIINQPIYNIELTKKEARLLQYCIYYCWHRLNQHQNTGLHSDFLNQSWVNHFRTILNNKLNDK